VGLARCLPIGAAVHAGDPLAIVHAASDADAEAAVAAVRAAIHVSIAAPTLPALVVDRIG
jgi:thymidine phosphorylase